MSAALCTAPAAQPGIAGADLSGKPARRPSLARYRDCLDALWAWIPVADDNIPGCVTEQDALEAEDLLIEGPAGL